MRNKFQLVNFHECLYEFRESAEFIAFPDWDDLLMTPKFTPLPDILDKLKKEMPDTGVFIMKRYIGAVEKLGRILFRFY